MENHQNDSVGYLVIGIVCGILGVSAGVFMLWRALHLITLSNVLAVFMTVALFAVILLGLAVVVFVVTHPQFIDTAPRKVIFALLLIANVALIISGVSLLIRVPGGGHPADGTIALMIVVSLLLASVSIGLFTDTIIEARAMKRKE